MRSKMDEGATLVKDYYNWQSMMVSYYWDYLSQKSLHFVPLTSMATWLSWILQLWWECGSLEKYFNTGIRGLTLFLTPFKLYLLKWNGKEGGKKNKNWVPANNFVWSIFLHLKWTSCMPVERLLTSQASNQYESEKENFIFFIFLFFTTKPNQV